MSRNQAVSLCRFVHRKTVGFQPKTADLLENLLEKSEREESLPSGSAGHMIIYSRYR